MLLDSLCNICCIYCQQSNLSPSPSRDPWQLMVPGLLDNTTLLLMDQLALAALDRPLTGSQPMATLMPENENFVAVRWYHILSSLSHPVPCLALPKAGNAIRHANEYIRPGIGPVSVPLTRRQTKPSSSSGPACWPWLAPPP